MDLEETLIALDLRHNMGASRAVLGSVPKQRELLPREYMHGFVPPRFLAWLPEQKSGMRLVPQEQLMQLTEQIHVSFLALALADQLAFAPVAEACLTCVLAS